MAIDVVRMRPMPDQLYVYQSRCERVVDGDTMDVTISLGLHDYRLERVRLAGVDCPEVRGPTRDAGLAATRFTAEWMSVASRLAGDGPWPLIVQTLKDPDHFGRWLGVFWRCQDHACLNDDLVTAGFAEVI